MAVQFNAGPLFGLADNSFWPSLARQQVIPSLLASATTAAPPPPRLKNPQPPRHVVGLGVVKAIYTVLEGTRLQGMAYLPLQNRWSLTVSSLSTPGTVHALGGDLSTWWASKPGYLQAIVWLVDALTISKFRPEATEFVQRWEAYLTSLQTVIGASPPYSAQQLFDVARAIAGGRPSPATEGMMSVSDALYYFAKARAAGAALQHIELSSDPAPLVSQQHAIATWLYRQAPVNAPATAVSPAHRTRRAAQPAAASSSGQPLGGAAPSQSVPGVSPTDLPSTLRRVIRSGRTCLLVGPTGNGKSKAARMAARDEHCAIAHIVGYPTMTDREFFGKPASVTGADGQVTYPWMDGPLGLAWRAAQRGQHVVLIIDELGRFDPYYLAPLLGALETLPGEEVASMLGLDGQARAAVRHDMKYRVLHMPNGEHLVAPTTHLACIASTNVGADYQQAQQEFDTALLRRFQVHFDVQRLDAPIRQRILQEEQHLPRSVAAVLVDAEDFSTQQTGAYGGMMRRELNLGTCMNWAEEACDLYTSEGLTWAPALLAAAEHTAIPYMCARGTDGYIDKVPADIMRDWLRRALNAAHLP